MFKNIYTRERAIHETNNNQMACIYDPTCDIGHRNHAYMFDYAKWWLKLYITYDKW